ncbi:MAG: hypothetical protein EBU67_07610 [Actinobacteria bacterium]|nr:hypothetical protein [Actinomycetota bacterium]
MSTTNPATSNPSGAPGDAIPAVYRRLIRALGDLGITPQPIDDEPKCWAILDTHEGSAVVAFGSLSLEATARLANLLEDLVSGVPASSITPASDDMSGPDAASEYVMAPFEPVASPLEPFQAASRHHPRTAW